MTAQIPEILILDGKKVAMTYCPPLPEGHPRIIEADTEDNSGDELTSRILNSTACWRRYQGTWEIKDGQFFLTGLRGIFQFKGDQPLLADWFTGVIRIPRGKLLQYIHMGFGSVYEEELHIVIEQGAVTKSRTINNRGMKFDLRMLSLQNMPGGENFFPGYDEL